MRIYKAVGGHEELGNVLAWEADKGAAHQWRQQWNDDGRLYSFKVVPVDFKPTRAGVLSLLRQHTPDTDNG